MIAMGWGNTPRYRIPDNWRGHRPTRPRKRPPAMSRIERMVCHAAQMRSQARNQGRRKPLQPGPWRFDIPSEMRAQDAGAESEMESGTVHQRPHIFAGPAQNGAAYQD